MFDFCGRKLDLAFPHVMGVVNVTPDSFSDGGELLQAGSDTVLISKVLARAEKMLASGAAIIDVGGESTRPGAALVSSQAEIDRVLPVVEAINNKLDVIVSVDTSNPELIKLCADYDVGLINDVRALSKDGALQAAAQSGIPVCLMHMQGDPETMQDAPAYDGIIEEISSFLFERVAACEEAGIIRSKIMIDPGFGFGKTLNHNLELLRKLDYFNKFDLPILIGLSRKRMIGAITGKVEKERMAGGLAAAVISALKGAKIIRTHDVGQTVDAMKVCQHVMNTNTELAGG